MQQKRNAQHENSILHPLKLTSNKTFSKKFICSLTICIVAFVSALCTLPFIDIGSAHAQGQDLTFSYNSNYQWVDPAGRNQVSFALNQPIDIQFELYEMPLADFVSYQGTRQPYEGVKLDTEGLTLVESWNESYMDIEFSTAATTTIPAVGSGRSNTSRSNTSRSNTSTSASAGK